MGAGQACAYGVNVLFSHGNAAMADAFDPTSWFFPTFLNDILVAVPLGVALWHSLLFAVASFGRSCPNAPCVQAS